MNNLTERQKFILSLVIHEYTRDASPIGSKNLVEKYKLDISSATVRNELAALTDLGYLRQPYTSAGREPTEEGYRYFVGRLLRENELPESVRKMITHQFYQTRHDVGQWMRLAASILANQSQAASLITAPHTETARFRHLELISTHGRQVLMVLVLMGGEVHQRILTLDEPMSQDNLSSSTSWLSSIFHGMDVAAIRANLHQTQDFDLVVTKWILEEMGQIDSLISGEIYLDGFTNVLAKPEFAHSDEARRALKVLEERSLLQDLLARVMSPEQVDGVQVLIGGEGTFDELSECSVILAKYGSPGNITGTLGILGPIRMYYGRSISTIRFLSNLLSDMVVEQLGN